MERIVSKVKEERITKIVEEFEENNKHGFDNTKGDKHVVGVFRWVDKVYKNQVLNFGKRLMFEFMVPEPAKLHLLGMSENKEATSLIKPSDPRKFEDPSGAIIPLKVSDYTKINDNTVKYWGGVFNVELKPMPDNTISISHSFQDRTLGIDDLDKVGIEALFRGTTRNSEGVLFSGNANSIAMSLSSDGLWTIFEYAITVFANELGVLLLDKLAMRAKQEVEPLELTHNEFITFMKDFKKFIEENS